MKYPWVLPLSYWLYYWLHKRRWFLSSNTWYCISGHWVPTFRTNSVLVFIFYFETYFFSTPEDEILNCALRNDGFRLCVDPSSYPRRTKSSAYTGAETYNCVSSSWFNFRLLSAYLHPTICGKLVGLHASVCYTHYQIVLFYVLLRNFQSVRTNIYVYKLSTCTPCFTVHLPSN
jgi:hypothetical protein